MKLTVKEYLDFLNEVKPKVSNDIDLEEIQRGIDEWSIVARYPLFLNKEVEISDNTIYALTSLLKP